MSNGLRITVRVPAGQFEMDSTGLTYVPGEAGGKAYVLSLTEAERVFNAVARSAAVLLEVEGGRGTELLADSGHSDPSGPPLASLTPYCPFCQAPTCKCWEDHECR